ncbi:hypothetical protein KPH14_004156 [Odynerus spinipes]|uniref:PBZ-type domain-containing protein n=1 Tax=Odynerus spinipes TaxID=1348599 RepID=A0AAD9VW33_9HYME|nr:hypothetical protein KPH14_004156 [Odynerus spinipes]
MPGDCENEAFLAYKNDSRMPCRYGAKCYQKNPLHHEKYKHPPKKKDEKATQKKQTGSKRKIEEPNCDREESETISLPNNLETEETHLGTKSNDEKVIENIEQEIKEESTISHNNSNSADDDSFTILSPDNMEENILNLFLVKMPEDFYQLYEFCKLTSNEDPLKTLKPINLYLVGPYDILNCKLKSFKNNDKEKYLRHWRYYYDPPEFQTIIRGDKDGLHFGYWRDEITEKPIFVAKNKADVNCVIEPVAENIFGTINNCIEDALKVANLFEKPSISQLHKRLKEFAHKHNITLERKTDKMRSRERKVVARTFHKAGIVVPYNKKTQLGYRELAVMDKELQKILKDIDEAGSSEERKKAMSKLDEIVRLATIAADECDFGTCLELAHDLFSSGSVHVEKIALQMFSIAYTHLDRLGFLEIVKAHLKDRKRGTDLSVI